MTDDETYKRLESVLAQYGWQNEAAQVKARAYLTELGLADSVKWTYGIARLLRNASFLQLMASWLQDVSIDRAELMQLGRFWESVAGLPENIDRVAAAIMSAVAYEIAGSPANSAAVLSKYKREFEKSDDLLLKCFTALFSRRLIFLRQKIGHIKSSEFAELGILQASIIEAILHVAEFMLSGEIAKLGEAKSSLGDSSAYALATGAIREHLISSSLAKFCEVIAIRSIWTELPCPSRVDPTSWRRYLQLLSRGQGRDLILGHSITQLWPSQRSALKSGVLDDSIKSLVVRMPTSAGKTRIAELAIVKLLLSDRRAKAVYIAPFRALANELLGTFRRLLSDLGFAVSASVTSYEYDELQEQLIADADLSIVTPERLDLLLRLGNDVLRHIRLVILDEGHILEDESRGAKIELLLTRLRRKLPDARFLIASAVLGEKSLMEVSQWLRSRASGKGTGIAQSSWRPSLQQIARFEWRGNNGFLTFMDLDQSKSSVETFLPGVIRKRDISYVKPETGRRNIRHFGQDKGDVAAELALKLSKLGPVLIYVSQPTWTLAVASRIFELVAIDPDSRPEWWGNDFSDKGRAELVASDWNADLRLTDWFSKGVAIHHGELPDALKDAIEKDARERRFRIIIATGTLSAGVNIPIRSVIVHSYHRNEGERSRPMPSPEYWNIAGRAGRAGLETEGLIVHIVDNADDRRALDRYITSATVGVKLTSRLLQVALALEKGIMQSVDVESLLDPEILALVAEETSIEAATGTIEDVLSESLGAQQAALRESSLKPISLAMRKRAIDIFKEVPDFQRRRVYSKTGLSAHACSMIASALDDNRDVRDLLKSDDVDALLPAFYRVVQGSGEIVDIGLSSSTAIEALLVWTNADPVEHVLAALRKDGIDRQKAQKVIDHYFRYLLPWYFSSALQIAASVYALDGSTFSLTAKMLPAMLRYGVPTVTSCYAMGVGIPTRTAAVAVSDQFDAISSARSFNEFRSWISALDRTQFSEQFAITGAFIGDLFESLHSMRRSDIVIEAIKNDEVLPRTVNVTVAKNRKALSAMHDLRAGTVLTCRRSYADLFDRNAIELVRGELVIGHLSTGDGRILAAELDAGNDLSAFVLKVETRKLNTQIKVCVDVASGS